MSLQTSIPFSPHISTITKVAGHAMASSRFATLLKV
jgi:hypothetical protein